MNQEPNKCPQCGFDELKYGSADIEDNIISQSYTCTGCGFAGVELNRITFIKHVNLDGSAIK